MRANNDKPCIGEELSKMHTAPLLPIEKKPIAWSLILGIVLLVVLILTGNACIPTARAEVAQRAPSQFACCCWWVHEADGGPSRRIRDAKRHFGTEAF